MNKNEIFPSISTSLFSLYLFIASVWLPIFLLMKLKRRSFTPFIHASPKRIFIWNWTKKVLVILISPFLVFKAIERFYYFHDEVEHTDKKLLDMAYVDQIETQSYLMDQQSLASLFQEKNNPKPETCPVVFRSIQAKYLPSSQLYFYLVIQIKNKGDRVVWGSLNSYLNEKQLPDIDVPPLPPNMTDFVNIVVWSGKTGKSLPAASCPKLTTAWKEIYTSQGNGS
jgi:hypothetical protein